YTTAMAELLHCMDRGAGNVNCSTPEECSQESRRPNTKSNRSFPDWDQDSCCFFLADAPTEKPSHQMGGTFHARSGKTQTDGLFLKIGVLLHWQEKQAQWSLASTRK